MEPAEILNLLDHRRAGGDEIASGLIFRNGRADGTGDAAVGGNAFQGDVDQFSDIVSINAADSRAVVKISA